MGRATVVGLVLDSRRGRVIVARSLARVGRIAGAVARQKKWFVVGLGHGTVLETGSGGKLVLIDLNMASIYATMIEREVRGRDAQLASSQSIPRF